MVHLWCRPQIGETGAVVYDLEPGRSGVWSGICREHGP